MTTILLSPRGTMDSNDVWRACIKKGWNSHRSVRHLLPDPIPEALCVYGENYFCDIMADRAGLALLDPPDYWLPSLSDTFLLRKVWHSRAEELQDFEDGRLFYKPANDKVFTAGVYERGRDVPVRHVDPDCPCLVSEVVAFDIEVRLHMLDGVVQACQQYRLYGEREEDEVHEEAKAFAAEVMAAEADRLPSSIVLDVGYVEDRGWCVVEANPLYSSGIYAGTDAVSVLDCILRASGPASLLKVRDMPFLRNRDVLSRKEKRP